MPHFRPPNTLFFSLLPLGKFALEPTQNTFLKIYLALTGHFDVTKIVLMDLGGTDMKVAAVSELKARLSKYLNRVKPGEEVLITDRGKPVARLLPISRAKTAKETMASMEKRGLIRVGSGKLPKDFWERSKAEDSEGLVLRALLEEREGGR